MDAHPEADLRWPSAPRPWRILGAFLLVAGILDAVVNVLLSLAAGRGPRVWYLVTATVPSWAILAAMLPAFFHLAERHPFHGRSPARSLLVHVPAALGLAVAHLVLAVVISDVLLSTRAAEVGFDTALRSAFSNYLVFDLLVYAGIVGLYYAFHFHDRHRAQAEAASRLRASLSEAQMRALRAQLDPHFLFNALNAISGTALKRDPERTAALIADLSQLLRRSLGQPAAEVPLAEELDFLEAYLSIERARMGGRLTTHVDVPSELRTCTVPSLLLQPLVENAIRHGLADQPRGGAVGVSVRASGGRVVIEVWDDGRGFDAPPDDARRDVDGVGLRNTRARLAERYGPDAALRIADRTGGGTVVTVDIPS